MPSNCLKAIMVVAPHTSNIDFFIGVATRDILKIDIKYIAKKELFVWPFKGFFTRLGGYPVDRSKKGNTVDFVSGLFANSSSFYIAVTPEGTRSKVDKWKTGFYRIAEKASVPIVMVSFNYELKKVTLNPPFWVTGNMESDIEKMKNSFKSIRGRHPEKGVS